MDMLSGITASCHALHGGGIMDLNSASGDPQTGLGGWMAQFREWLGLPAGSLPQGRHGFSHTAMAWAARVASGAAIGSGRMERYARGLEDSNAELRRLAHRHERAREEAEAANRAKSSFLAGMTHELRTPVNGILGYAQLLRHEGGLTAGQSARVDAMLDAGSYLLDMIHGVLDMSEIETGHAVVRPAAVDPRGVAAACLALIRPVAEAKGLTLSLRAAQEVPSHILADPGRLRQVLLNLLGNAAKFTPSGSIHLRLRLAEDGSMLRAEVADTGPGVPAAQRGRLFHDFERIESGSAGPTEGAGLGLAISVRLAALMGGRLGHRDNQGGGSVFWLDMPLVACPAAAAQPVAASVAMVPDARQALAAMRVLVVDDNAMNRDIAASFLRAAGHCVTTAAGGAEAVAAAAGEDFDAVLMDVRMAGMDGLEATRRIRALEGGRGQVPVVAMTARAFANQVQECLDAGMDGHLAKPFTPESLTEALGTAAAGRRRQAAAPAPHAAAQSGRALPVAGPRAFAQKRVRAPAFVAAMNDACHAC
jgi:signal transduction histidine kinase/CheY-like chemotaxis protein